MKHKWIAAIAASICLAVILIAAVATGQSGYKSFQLVYHSDTRGYYRPCG